MANSYGNLAGQTLGNFLIDRLVGQGGMGAVYLAQQLRPSRNVAVKVLQPNLAMNSEIYQEFLTRFRREADVIARLEHVNIMPIYEYGEQDNLAYLVMPYLAGGSLRDILIQRGALTLNEAITYTEQAASALDYAHSQGVIHRDLKPANFLLASDGRLVLADFGIARIMEESASSNEGLTSAGTILGTPEYMAPEMARGETIDYRADIYELGIVLFQMLSGHVPFSGSNPLSIVAKHIQEPLPLLQRENPAISPAIDAVLQKATAKYANDRYASAGSMAQALRNASTMGTMGAGTATYYDRVGESAPPARPATRPFVLPGPTTPPYNTLAAQQRPPQTMPPVPGWENTGASYGNYGQQPGAFSNYRPPAATPQRSQKPLMWAVGILLALVLTVFGVLAGINLTKNGGNSTGNQQTTTGNQQTTTTQATTAPQATATTPPTAQPTATTPPTAQPTATTPPTAQPTTAVTGTLTQGQELYTTITPGPMCDQKGGMWTQTSTTLQITCQATKTKINNPDQNLVGIFLTTIPAQNPYPTDYVVHARLQQATSNADFGLLFRDGTNTLQGTYAFLIHNDGSWSVSPYTNGAPGQPIAQGTAGTVDNVHAALTMDVVASGQQLTFFINGNQVGTMSDATFTSGSAGIAVGAGGTITATNFQLHATAH